MLNLHKAPGRGEWGGATRGRQWAQASPGAEVWAAHDLVGRVEHQRRRECQEVSGRPVEEQEADLQVHTDLHELPRLPIALLGMRMEKGIRKELQEDAKGEGKNGEVCAVARIVTARRRAGKRGEGIGSGRGRSRGGMKRGNAGGGEHAKYCRDSRQRVQGAGQLRGVAAGRGS